LLGSDSNLAFFVANALRQNGAVVLIQPVILARVCWCSSGRSRSWRGQRWRCSCRGRSGGNVRRPAIITAASAVISLVLAFKDDHFVSKVVVELLRCCAVKWPRRNRGIRMSGIVVVKFPAVVNKCIAHRLTGSLIFIIKM